MVEIHLERDDQKGLYGSFRPGNVSVWLCFGRALLLRSHLPFSTANGRCCPRSALTWGELRPGGRTRRCERSAAGWKCWKWQVGLVLHGLRLNARGARPRMACSHEHDNDGPMCVQTSAKPSVGILSSALSSWRSWDLPATICGCASRANSIHTVCRPAACQRWAKHQAEGAFLAPCFPHRVNEDRRRRDQLVVGPPSGCLCPRRRRSGICC